MRALVAISLLACALGAGCIIGPKHDDLGIPDGGGDLTVDTGLPPGGYSDTGTREVAPDDVGLISGDVGDAGAESDGDAGDAKPDADDASDAADADPGDVGDARDAAEGG